MPRPRGADATGRAGRAPPGESAGVETVMRRCPAAARVGSRSAAMLLLISARVEASIFASAGSDDSSMSSSW